MTEVSDERHTDESHACCTDAGSPSADHGRSAPWSVRPLLAVVRWYQLAREGRPSPCRFVPSCSTYATEALQEHGLLKGSWLSARRLGRCHPWGGQGYDPVPSRSGDQPDPHRSTWNGEPVLDPPTPCSAAVSPTDEKVP